MHLEFQEAKTLTGQDGFWLCLKAPLNEINQVIQKIKPEKRYSAQIKEVKRKRSLDANAYLWVLIGKLSAALKLPPQEVYRDCIHDIGGNYTVLPIRNDAVDEWCNTIWPGKGLGWITDNLGPSKIPGYTNIVCYYGSSVYDTKTMARLIDLVVEECKAQNIETLPPDELERMESLWKAAEQAH